MLLAEARPEVHQPMADILKEDRRKPVIFMCQVRQSGIKIKEKFHESDRIKR